MSKSQDRQKLLDEFQSFIEGLEGMDETFRLLPWQKLAIEELLIGGGSEELAVHRARGHGRSVVAEALERFRQREENEMAENKKEYVCPQCGPDTNGGAVHALTHHTLPLYPEREALEIVELTETIVQKNECIDNRNRTLNEQYKLIDELKAWKMVDEQKLIDAGEELQHIRLKPLLDAACTFLSGDGEGAEVVSDGTDDVVTRLEVITPTWEDLCSAVDRYRARNVKVFRLNDYEWYAAETLESAIGEAVRITGVPADEIADDAGELTEEQMDRLVFYDNMEDQEASETRTFREQLDDLIERETEFPIFFAGTEA